MIITFNSFDVKTPNEPLHLNSGWKYIHEGKPIPALMSPETTYMGMPVHNMEFFGIKHDVEVLDPEEGHILYLALLKVERPPLLHEKVIHRDPLRFYISNPAASHIIERLELPMIGEDDD